MSMLDGKTLEQCAPCKTGVELIAEERDRQVGAEGFNDVHDSQYHGCELVRAAVCYASVPVVRVQEGTEVADTFLSTPPYELWPWDETWWKPGSDIRCLIKAGALIAAEIDRRVANGEPVE